MVFVTRSMQKFAVLVDLGIVTVPRNYVSATHFGNFCKNYSWWFDRWDKRIADKKSHSPLRVMNPGEKFHVRVFHQVLQGSSTDQERTTFLATQKAVHTGVWGLALIFTKRSKVLPEARYTFYEEPDCVPKDDLGFPQWLTQKKRGSRWESCCFQSHPNEYYYPSHSPLGGAMPTEAFYCLTEVV